MNIIKETESHFLIKGPVHPKNITVLNIYVPSNRASKYMKKKAIELLGETDKSPRIVEDFKTRISTISKTSRRGIGKDIERSTYAIDQPFPTSKRQ